MKLKRVQRLDEGPLDFLRGAGSEAGRQVKNSGLGRAVGSMVQAGRDASAAADARALQGELVKAVQQLAKLAARYNEMNGEPPDENPQGERRINPMPADNGQRPHQQQQDNTGYSKQQSGGVAKPFQTDVKPKGRVGKHGFEFTFDSFMQMTFADQEQLDEGILDFLKGAAGSGAREVIDRWKTASKNSTLAKMYQAGKKASAEGDMRSLEAKIQKQANLIHAIAQKMGPRGEPAIQAAIEALPQPIQRTTMSALRRTKASAE